MAGGKIAFDPAVSVSTDTATRLGRHALEVGDVIAARRGELGRCAEVTPENEGALCGTGSILIRPQRGKLTPTFLQLVLSSRRISEVLQQHSVGSTMANLNASIMGQLRIPLPGPDEQNEVVALLARQFSAIDSLSAKGDEFLRIAQERRAALITAAVTGQLDVGEAA
jgi:type I restriction enzyme S subunit